MNASCVKSKICWEKHANLAARKSTILSTIAEQGKLTPQLQQEITACSDPARLEELYLPYRPRRRTCAAAARERGLQPLADILLSNAPLPEPRAQLLKRFLSADKGVPDEAAAASGCLRHRRRTLGGRSREPPPRCRSDSSGRLAIRRKTRQSRRRRSLSRLLRLPPACCGTSGASLSGPSKR
ncbi:MAG UNVERIFIED_CONTAM: hypothetical protein LVR18_43560 [Planctomycetaceae bacterium]